MNTIKIPDPKEFAKKIINARLAKNWDQVEFENRSRIELGGFSRRTLRKLENGQIPYVSEKVLMILKKILGLEWEEMGLRIGSPTKKLNFKISPLEILLDDKLKKISFRKDTHILNINRPILLLESLSGDNQKFKLGDKATIKPTNNYFEQCLFKEDIQNLMGDNTIVRFGNVKICWDKGYSEWPPSIDALFTAKNIIHSKEIQKICKVNDFSLGEIGTGSGFISSVFAKYYHPKSIIVTDTEKKCVQLAKKNVRANRKNFTRILGLSGAGIEPLRKDKVPKPLKLLVLTAPYVPNESNDDDPFETVISNGLLLNVLDAFSTDWAMHLLITYSSVGINEFNNGYKLLEKKLKEKVEKKDIDSLWVPFRVKKVSVRQIENLVNANLILDLEKKNIPVNDSELKLFKTDNRGFRYWHKLLITLFTARE
jgi:methylase of polypeptide subunit release factors